MSEIRTALGRLKNAGMTWREIGRKLDVSDVYVAMLARGERKIRDTNPLKKRLLALKSLAS